MSKTIHDSMSLAQAFQASKLYDSTHGSESVDDIEALLAAEQVVASATGPEAEELVKRVAAPLVIKSDLGGHDHLWAALVLMQQEKFTEAAKHFEQAMVLSVRHWRLNCYLAGALGKSGSAGEAFLSLNAARQVAGNQTFVLRVQQELLSATTARKECNVSSAPLTAKNSKFDYGYEAARSKVEAVPGLLCSGQEEFLFNKVCSLPNDAVIVEIGSFKGRSTVAMGLACLNTKRRLLCIDTWDVENWEGSAKSFPDGGTFPIWKHSVSSNGLDQHVAPIRGNSHEVLTQWAELDGGRMIDFIFIDGSHDYANVLRDFELALPWVKPGGWIAFHDVVETWPGPLRVWREHASTILQAHEVCSTIACGQKPLAASTANLSPTKNAGVTLPDQSRRVRNFIISGTNGWNPGDDFVRDGVIQVLRQTFPGDLLNFHFYNFAEDQFPKSKFRGIGNEVSAGDLELCRDFIDGVIIAGLSAGHEIKDLYKWILANRLEDRVFLIGAGYENSYCAGHVLEEPEATIFRKARIIIGRTASHPGFIKEAGTPYVHLNCPALLSVLEVKPIAAGKKIQRIGFSIQLPHETGIVNQSCDAKVHRLACQLLLDLSKTHEVELIAHHKSEYFLFLHLLKGTGVPVIYSSFYQDLHDVYRRYDCVITTRLHSSLYANGHGIPGIIVNDTDRHTHTLSGFPHSVWVNTREAFDREFARINRLDLAAVSAEMDQFKTVLTARYVNTLRPLFLENEADRVTSDLGGISPMRSTMDKLNIGCGSDYREGFLNLDGNAKLPKVDVVLDVRPGVLPGYFAKESFRHVLAKDFLEHHTHWEAVQLLKDFRAVLKSGGELELLLPNVEAIINDLNLPIGEKKTSLYGGQDITQPWESDSPNLNRKLYPQYFCHKFGWTPDDLRKELLAVGFDRVEIAPVGNGWNMHVRAFNPDRLQPSDAAALYQFDSEKKEQLLVRSLVKPGMTVLDVGAHLGKYTKLFSLIVGAQGRVFSFEPTPVSASKLAERIKSDHLDNVTLIRKAVCDHNGTVTLHQFPEEYSSWNSLGRPSMEDPRDVSKLVPIVSETEVPATTLDEFCQSQGLTRIDYLKVDVEGAEIHALHGAADLLRRQAIGCLQFEVSRKMLDGLGTCARDVFEFLAGHGYECHAIREDGRVGPVTTDSESFYDNYIAFPLKVAAPINPAKNLSINFFTIVLNGQPFIRHHVETLRQLPFQWHWHIVEGVAELKHDTGWSVATGGRVPDSSHKQGLSVDGTTEYLDELKRAFPDRITIHRPPSGKFWDGKREMVNAPLASITGECLLWQVDADELWTATQITRCRALFLAHPEKTAAMFFCHYFVGPDRVITSRDTYGNNSSYEWLRVWRFQTSDHWLSHEPPRLGRSLNAAPPVDVAALNSFTHTETEAMGLVFQHFAYATEAQVAFKETYYGYPGAVAQWRQLQNATNYPQRLADHFAWVKDQAIVNTTKSVGLHRLAPDAWFNVPATEFPSPLAGVERILFVRTDSIGDAVLASAMLEPIRKKYPQAQLAVLCQQHVAELFTASPWVNAVICYDHARMADAAERQQILSEIAAFNPAVILNSVRSRDHLSNALTQGFRHARHIAIEGDLNNISAADHAASLAGYELLVPSPGAHPSELEHHANFLRGLGIESQNLQPVLWLTTAEELVADAFFQQHGLDPQRTVALFPFTQHGIKNYAHFAPALEKLTQWNFLIFGGAESENGCTELATRLPGTVHNLAGRTTVREMAALIRRCRLLVGSDSCGPHIACAVGVPNVVILGGGHFGRFMPYSPLTTAVCLPLDCYGCSWGCSHPRAHCVKDIPASLVAEAIRQTLAAPSTRPRIFVPAETVEGVKGTARVRQMEAMLGATQVEFFPIPTASAVHGPEGVGNENGPPVVSVIISTYNSEKFMAACMEDVLAQTILDKMEILVIDSGSEENEGAIVAKYQQKHANIRYIRTEREPLYVAWNRAVKLARGKFVVNANTDDSRRPDAFEVLLEAMENHADADLAYSYYGITSKPNDAFPPTSVFQNVRHDPYHPVQLLFYCVTGCLQFWRKTSLEKIGGFDESLKCVADYEILIRFMRQGMKPILVPEPLSCFYINMQGLSFGSTTAATEDLAITNRYRSAVSAAEIYDVDPANAREMAKAWVNLGNFAAAVPVPWDTNPHRYYNYAIQCYQQAMTCDQTCEAVWHNLAVISRLLGVADHFLKTFRDTRNISRIIARAKTSPTLIGFHLEPKVAGHVYQRANASSARLVEGASRPTPPAARPASTGNAAQRRTSVAWEGSFLDFGSLSHVNRELTRALADSDHVRLQCVNAPAQKNVTIPGRLKKFAGTLAKKPSADTQVTIRHAWPPNWQRPAQGKLVVIQPWEFGSLPQDWVNQAGQVDEFWVPSNYVRNVYTSSGIAADKVQVVPNGIDPERFRPDATPRKISTSKSFKFLFVGGTIARKGPDILLDAFLKAFTAADDVTLIIKDFGGNTFYKGQTLGTRIAEAQRRPNAPEIIHLDNELAPEELPGIYTACDCLVHPYRGEGFGLPVLEAMACNLPVIVTGGGATDDFATDELAYRLPAQRRGIGQEISGMKLAGEAWLLEPDVHALVDQLKWVVANREAARAKGQKAGAHVRTNWTWKHAAQIAAARLRQITATPGTPATPTPTKTAPVQITAAPVARIGSLQTARAACERNDFQTAWSETLAAINQRPFHPEAFLLLAEIALAAGDARTARQFAEHARKLAPAWEKPKQFLKQPLKGDTKHDWLKLPDCFTSHVSRLTVCLIAKNEEQFLGQCLKSIHGFAQQIIVVDTGSTDRTVDIAKEFGAEIYTSAWAEDFSAARNAALEHATGDWILMLDADEELPAAQHVKLLADMKSSQAIAHRLPLANVGQNDGQSFVPRLFRNAPGVFYHGRIHEQVFPSLVALAKPWGLTTNLGTAELLHHGYTKELVRDRNKIERNLRLLRLAVGENPGDSNLVMNFGLELVRSGDLAGGIEKYRAAFEMMSAQPPGEVVPELREVLLTQFTSQLYKVRGHEEVLRVLASPLAKNGGLTASLHFMLGLSNFELQNHAEAAAQMRQCLLKRKQPALSPINTDIHTAAPSHCLALSLARLGDFAGAEKAFQAALTETGRTEEVKVDYAKFLVGQNRQLEALQQLHEIIDQNARHAAAWRLGGEIALSKPEFLEFARDWTGEAARNLAEDIAITAQRAEALMLSGDLASARELWERIYSCDPQPRALAALILCEASELELVHAPADDVQEGRTSREFIGWYQKLLTAKAQPTIERLHQQNERLSSALPTAAGIIEKVLFELERCPAATA